MARCGLSPRSNFVDAARRGVYILIVSTSVTMEAKNAAKRAYLLGLSEDERLLYPLYLHYRNMAITASLKQDYERSAAKENS